MIRKGLFPVRADGEHEHARGTKISKSTKSSKKITQTTSVFVFLSSVTFVAFVPS
jgi:hypothetical protein